jgi:putative ABC transport system permease protein
MLHDLRQALRNLSRTPWLAGVIVVSLAVGTGANAAVYSAVDALLFRAPAGVTESARLVDIYTSQTNGATYGASSYPDFVSFTAGAPLDAAAAIDERAEEVVHFGDATVNARVAAVSENFWDVLRAHPHLGQWPRAARPQDVVIGYDVWQGLGAPADVLGRSLTIGGRGYTVVGIAPRGFRGLHLDRVFGAWTRLDAGIRRSGRGVRRLKIVGRLASRASLEDLEHSLDEASRTVAVAHPETNQGTIRSADEPRRFTALAYSRLGPDRRSQAQLFAAVLLGATCLLLLSACVNAGSLLLSRGIARRTELTIKMALGAGRGPLMRQLIIESVLLALAGAAAGLLTAMWTAASIPALFAPEHARLLDTRVEPSVMWLTMTVGMAAGVLCGIAPAVHSTRSLSPNVLRGDPGGLGDRQGSAKLRMLLVGAQLALSTIFLVESALLTKVVNTALSTSRPQALDPLVIASIESYSYDPAYRDAATARLKRVSSSARAGWTSSPPLTRPARREFRIDRGSTTEWVDFETNFATRDYFSVMSIPLIDGRLFTPEEELSGAELAIVNDALVQRYFSGAAVGHTLTDAEGRTVEIIGVVRTQSYRAFEGPPQPMVYYPMSKSTARGFFAVVRAVSGAVDIEQDVFNALKSAGKVRKLEVSTFDAHLSRGLAADRLMATLVAACGAIALVLAAIGVYGVMADLIGRRTREIGLRIALGASPWRIIRGFAGVTLRPALGGITAGLIGAALLVRIAQSLVYGLAAIDANLVATVVAGLWVVVGAAFIPPARRVLRVSPLLAFRDPS